MGLLELETVTKVFDRGDGRVVALRGVSLSVDPGECVGIWGRRNSGKSTLIRVAAGVCPPDEGSVRFDGRDLADLSQRAHARLLMSEIGCVWQSVAVPPQLTVLELVMMPLMKRERAAHARKRAMETLVSVGAGGCADARWWELGDGDRALASIAMAVVRRPRLLLADEPAGRLNIVEREEVLAVLVALAEEDGTAVLMTAADPEGILQSHRLGTIDRGRLVYPEPKEGGSVVPIRPSTGDAGRRGA